MNRRLAFQQAHDEEYDLLILDVMMPGLDGWQVLERARAAGSETPALFLTARDQVEDRVKGLELGADDYLVKPFAFSELLARVRSLLRRGTNATVQTSLAIADMQVDLLKRRVERGGKRIAVGVKCYLNRLLHPKYGISTLIATLILLRSLLDDYAQKLMMASL